MVTPKVSATAAGSHEARRAIELFMLAVPEAFGFLSRYSYAPTGTSQADSDGIDLGDGGDPVPQVCWVRFESPDGFVQVSYSFREDCVDARFGTLARREKVTLYTLLEVAGVDWHDSRTGRTAAGMLTAVRGVASLVERYGKAALTGSDEFYEAARASEWEYTRSFTAQTEQSE